MSIKSFSWLGIASDNFFEDIELVQSSIGIKLTHIQGQHALFRLRSGQDLELFGPKSRWYPLQQSPVIGFETTNIGDLREMMENQNIRFISPIVDAPGWGKFCYFSGLDGVTYELVQRITLFLDNDSQAPSDFCGFSWAGLISPNFDATFHLFAQVCAFEVIEQDSYHATFALGSGQRIDVFHSSQDGHIYPLKIASICVGLDVHNINLAYQRMNLSDVVFLTEQGSMGNDLEFLYFLGPGKVPLRLQSFK